MDQQELYSKIAEHKEQLVDALTLYWKEYSGMGTWYFWFNIASMSIPLIVLYFTIDRKRIFEISFYGYTVHILWSNLDSVLSLNNYLVHPHTVSFLFPVGISMTAVMLPFGFMLLYQYCTNRGKNFYVYSIILSIIFSCVFAPITSALGLLQLHKGMNYFYLLLMDIVIVIVAYWFTHFFLRLRDKYVNN